MLFPVAPSKIVTDNEFENKYYTLIDSSRVSVAGGGGLRRFSFDLLLPMTKYPFATYESGFKDAQYYVEHLERMGKKKEAVDFELYRSYENSGVMYLTNVKVLPEKIVITEDASNGRDFWASVVLREYRSVETKIVSDKNSTYQNRADNYTMPDEYVVKKGDSLWTISKTVFGNGAKYTYLASINGIKSPYTIYAGQKLRLRED